MAELDPAKKLEMRIVELENTIKQLVDAKQASGISAEEMQTYMKVKSVVEPGYCGPNDCMTTLCVRCLKCLTCLKCHTFCINECICGPCIGGGGGVGGGGFGSLGG